MKEIPLTQGKVAIVDDGDYVEISKHNWHAMKGRSGLWYAARNVDCHYRTHRTELMHRRIMGTPSGLDTDHVDGDGLNNQRNNLRIATTHQNMHNRRTKSLQTQTKGVCKRRYCFEANITINKQSQYLGSYRTSEAAARAYDAAAVRLFGEFARLNYEEVKL